MSCLLLRPDAPGSHIPSGLRTSIAMREHDDTIDFAVRLIELMHHGRNTATYKYAVLLGLIDAIVSSFQDSGLPPSSVTTRQLAEKVIDLYWGHARRYTSTVVGDAFVLRQNTSPG